MTLPSFLFHVTGMTFCANLPVVLFHGFSSRPYSSCTPYTSHTRLFTWCQHHGSRCRARTIHHPHHTAMQSSILFPPTMSSTSFSLAPWRCSSLSTSAPSRSSCITHCGTVPRQDDHGLGAGDASLTGYEPKLLEIAKDAGDSNQIFTDRYSTNSSTNPMQQPDPVEIDDEHRRSELTPTSTASAGMKSKQT